MNESHAIRPRVVILGASNVSRSLDTIVDLARSIIGAPIDLYAAIGRGRSYGQWSSLLGRELPGILDCGLWDAVHASSSQAPLFALVTDIGNDIIYGVDPETLTGWIAESTRRLREHGARIVYTGLPIERLEMVRPLEFTLFTRLVFPSNRVTLEHGIEVAKTVHESTRDLASQDGSPFVPMFDHWYGSIDPVHVPHARAPEAWRHILVHWRPACQSSPPNKPRRSWRRWWRYTRLNPAHQKWLGRVVDTPQPALTLQDGSTISLY